MGKEKTSGGLTAAQLMKNKHGRVVSKAASASRKKAYKGSKAESWIKAVMAARKASVARRHRVRRCMQRPRQSSGPEALSAAWRASPASRFEARVLLRAHAGFERRPVFSCKSRGHVLWTCSFTPDLAWCTEALI